MALLPLAFALALMGQPAADQPVATSPTPAEASIASPSAAAPTEPPLPIGAPEDDYGFVNWCHGALTGHMELYPRVRDQLPADGYELDQQMLAAGRDYLRLYESAVQAADRASSTSRAAAAQAGRRAGANVWAGNERVDATTLKWAFLGWSLPGRCEVAARRLLAASELAAPALRTSGDTATVPAPAAEAGLRR